MAQKKIPARQCIGCLTSRPKKELVRVVRAPNFVSRIFLPGCNCCVLICTSLAQSLLNSVR